MASQLQRKAIEALQPAAEQIDDAIIFWKPFAAATFGFYVRFLGEIACKLHVDLTESLDRNKVIGFLRDTTMDQLHGATEELPVAISPARGIAPFELRGVIHPVQAGGLSKPTAFMKSSTYTTFPAYRCEFTDNDTRDEALVRINKTVTWSDWARDPEPALSARFLHKRTNVRSTGGKRMGVFPIAELERNIGYIGKDDGFIDIENYERALVHIEHEAGRYEVQQGEQKWIARNDAVVPWLRVFAIKGVKAADKERATYVA